MGLRVHNLVGVYLKGKKMEIFSELKLLSTVCTEKNLGGIIDDFLLATKNMSKMMVAMVINL